jgi:phosphoglycerate dehydrogenase-like enzyme
MRLLLTGAWASAEAHIPILEAAGHTVAFLQNERDPLPCAPAWVEGVVCNGFFLCHSIDELPNLRFIQLTSAGLDRVPLDRIRARGLRLCNARGVYSVPMAEFALAGVLALCKQTRFFLERQSAGVWEKRRDLRELAGSAVTVLGCGSVGTECAKRFSALGCAVTGVDLFPREDPAYKAVLPLKALDGLLPGTDVLILTLPLTPETRGLLDADRLARLKQGAILVNIARGAVADEAALADALANGRLFGAVLDVFETEPLPADSPLWAMENVILTPHNSFVGNGNDERLSRLILENLREAEP